MLGRFQRAWWCHLLVVLGGLHLLGGPLMILQCVAWGGMAVRYSAEDGLVQGLTDTFSGERPCALCECIETRTGEESSPSVPSREEQRRLAERLGQGFRDPDVLDVPESLGEETVVSGLRITDFEKPGGRQVSPETPPPRGVV